jgi:hypothetical protein
MSGQVGQTVQDNVNRNAIGNVSVVTAMWRLMRLEYVMTLMIVVCESFYSKSAADL